MRVLAGVLALLAACGARLDTNDQTGSDASMDVDSDLPPPPDMAPVCQKRQLFLSFEGATLSDAVASDAKQDLASWMTNGVTTATAPAYLAGNTDRATIIQNIVTAVTARVQPFTTVTTTRPATGDYMMIVFGGTAAAMGSNFGFVQELDCNDQARNDVAWVADGFPVNLIPNAVMGSIGFAIGLTATADPTDWMCSWDNSCRYSSNNCELHDGIARDQTANQLCPGAPAIQNEIVAFNTAFCN